MPGRITTDFKDLKLTPKRLEILDKLDIHNVDELLSYYPFRYDDNRLMNYSDFVDGQRVCFKAMVVSSAVTARYQRNRSVTRFKVMIDEEVLAVSAFNRSWLKLDDSKDVYIVGKYEYPNKITAFNVSQSPESGFIGIVPVYNLKEGITQNDLRKIIRKVYDEVYPMIEEIIPDKYLQRHGLIGRNEALKNVHFPDDQGKLRLALARLKYEEFLRFYVALNLRNSQSINQRDTIKEFDDDLLKEFIASLPFELTEDQVEAIEDIRKDLKSNKTMFRLLQGDVGSGKTVVAFASLYMNYLSGFQGAMMAPTEILALQHYESFRQMFKGRVKAELLSSSVDNYKRKEILDGLRSGKIDVLIGTHALFQDDVEFERLGLVVTDEQHRFGVKQRRALKEKGNDTDLLLMSATPIPRTLASSIYGDLAISSIKSMPKGRKGCVTTLIRENSIRSIVEEIKGYLAQGKQAYIVASAIEENSMDLKDVLRLYESIKNVFDQYNVAFLHGKMSSEEKEEIMARFNANQIQVLISTTVIEVGINVKNATIMVVYDADRFGLSQLHQLRGRIQRGNDLGHFYLLTDKKDGDILNRLNTLVRTNDGFEIAAEDLKERGPGDILGIRQSGLPSFILGDLLTDSKIVDAARKDAVELLEEGGDTNRNFIDLVKESSSIIYVD